MASNADTINKLKDTIANNPTAKKYMSKLAKDREKLAKFISKHKAPIIVTSVIIIILLIYFIVFFRRIPRYLNRMDKELKDIISVQPLMYNRNYMKRDYKLCDFWIASSYKSYLPCTNYYDYSSIDAIKQVLKYGCRY